MLSYAILYVELRTGSIPLLCHATYTVPGDNYNIVNSHVMPALIRKVHEAFMLGSQENIVVWGSGKPLREFLHVDDH